MPTITVVLIDALVTLLIGLGAFMYGRQVGEDHVVAQGARDEHTAQVAYEATQKATAELLNKIEGKHATAQELAREILKDPRFSDCRSGSDLVRNFNATIPGADAGADRKLPTPNAHR